MKGPVEGSSEQGCSPTQPLAIQVPSYSRHPNLGLTKRVVADGGAQFRVYTISDMNPASTMASRHRIILLKLPPLDALV